MGAVLVTVDDLGDIFDSEIKCSICRERLDDARFLSCHHSFCHDCLVDMVELNKTERVTCPLCRQITTLPDNDVAGLRVNGLANLMADVVKGSSCTKRPPCQAPDNDHSSNKTASFVCETCELAICGDCAMRDHRDPELHKTCSMDQAIERITDKLAGLLEWGKEEDERRNDAIADEEAKREDVRESLETLRRQVTESLGKEFESSTLLAEKIEKELNEIETALEEMNDSEEDGSLSNLNTLTEDIIDNANPKDLLDKHQVICKDYGREKVPRPISNRTQLLSDFVRNIRFQKARSRFRTFPTIGRLTEQRDWMVLQSRFESYSLPSSLCALSNGTVAVGFHGNESIRAYTKECKRCPEKHAESIAVKNMTSSPSRDSLVVLDQNNGVSSCSSMKNGNVKPNDSSHSSESSNTSDSDDDTCDSDHILGGVKRILQLDDDVDALPLGIHTDAKGNVLLMYEDYLSLYSPNGSLERTVPIRVASLQHVHGEVVQVRFQPSKNLLSEDENLRLLVSDESAVRLFQLTINRSSEGIVWDIKFPDDFPGARRFGEIDSEGNVFIVYLRDNLVSIRKYISVDDFESHEVVVDGLQVMVATSEVIHLAASSPDLLFMCTPQKLTVFRRETVHDFLKNNDLA